MDNSCKEAQCSYRIVQPRSNAGSILVEELILQAFESKALRNIFVAEKNEVMREYVIIPLIYFSYDVEKTRNMHFRCENYFLKCLLGTMRHEAARTGSGHIRCWV
jgi:hypothetical protein